MNGSVAADGGNLLMTEDERAEVIQLDPLSSAYIRPFVGGEDLIQEKKRYCFWLVDCPPDQLRQMPAVIERLRLVRRMREASSKAATRNKARIPSLFTENRQPKSGEYLAIPRTSSERRDILPIGFLPNTTIAANDLQIVPNSKLFHFGILSSLMHVAWIKITAGRLKSDYRYSALYTYNTFPWPEITTMQEQKISELAQDILDTRIIFSSSTLADLYDPDLMPPKLRKAHQALDLAVDRLYRKAPFASERERAEHLFGLYEKMVAPIEAAAKATVRKKRAATAESKARR
ncbi:type IIL restriction-modification enzyme MmeI [Mesorhizobium sp. M0312]|uniref:type IIL restriction-modification enzyme MmeI n=2 Tax=unclassified Mesorhizobium TaxID=325217 RepID=UPI003338D3A7